MRGAAHVRRLRHRRHAAQHPGRARPPHDPHGLCVRLPRDARVAVCSCWRLASESNRTLPELAMGLRMLDAPPGAGTCFEDVGRRGRLRWLSGLLLGHAALQSACVSPRTKRAGVGRGVDCSAPRVRRAAPSSQPPVRRRCA